MATESVTANPLLDFSGLPRFASIRAVHVAPAIDQLLAENRALLQTLVSTDVPASWADFVAPMDDANERLSRAWGAVGHLHSVLDSPELREAYSSNQPRIVQYYTELGQNLALFEKYKALRDSGEFAQLSPAQRRIVDNEIRDFRLSGAELDAADKQRFAQLAEELAALSTQFSEHLLDATNDFSLYMEQASELSGLPADVMQAAREAAQAEGKSGWKLTLRAPCLFPVLQYADNRELRKTLYHAYQTRASEFGRPELDNTPLIADILLRRREAAQLLGYKSHAEVSLVSKMADNPQQVLDFLNDLADRARPFARRDFDELHAFAVGELGLDDMQAWDMGYASEKLRVKRYAFSDNEVKQYFPEPRVLQGLFRAAEALYEIRITEDQTETWDPAVRFYRIAQPDGTLVGQFYLDLYARETKRGGAWMDEALTRRRQRGSVQAPVAYLVCNFPSPVGGKPALFTHDEVSTLFHEFGHGLHHMLTRVDFIGVSGIRGVEWDAVELPSQFMENFCWEWEVIAGMSAHVDTGEALPRSLFDKMVAARNFQSGMQAVRQIEFSLFDMHLHHDFEPEGIARGVKTPLQLLDEIRARVAVVAPPAWSRFPNSFSHIFAGGYSAGYYSYKWAEVLSADAYSAFEEQRDAKGGPVLDAQMGSRFRDEILAVGGSRPAMESFKAFRGREPRIDALLRHSGMIAA